MAISIYLADDHTVVIDGLRSLLEAEPDIKVIGYANDGRSAVQEIGKLMPNVVIMDIAMPDLNGIEATQLIQSRFPAIRVIILSMHSNSEHVTRALQAGARGYLLKASAGNEVIEAVRVVHAGQRYLSRKITDTVVDNYIGKRPATSLLDELSSRERQVLQLFAEGKSISVIAEDLALSPRTVETYRSRLMEKLGISNLPALVKFAIRHGITSLE